MSVPCANSQSSALKSSPIRRFGQRFVTRTVTLSGCPRRAASVTSTRNGGFQRTGKVCPFTVTSAKSRTSPRSRITFPPAGTASPARSIVRA